MRFRICNFISEAGIRKVTAVLRQVSIRVRPDCNRSKRLTVDRIHSRRAVLLQRILEVPS